MATLGGKTLDDLHVVTLTAPAGQPESWMAARCEGAWLEAQFEAVQVRDVEGEIMSLLLEQKRAILWFERAERTHPRYAEARQRKLQLDTSLDRAHVHLHTHTHLCWQSCIDLHVALSAHRNPRAWIESHPAELNLFRPIPAPADRSLSTDIEPVAYLPLPATRTRAPSPTAIWDVLMGSRPAPGTWPLGTPASDRQRLKRVEPWHRDWIRERLAEWQRTCASDVETQGQHT